MANGIAVSLLPYRAALALVLCLCAALAHAQSLQLDLDAVNGTGWSARKVQLALAVGGAGSASSSGGSAKLDLKGLNAQGRDLGDVSIACARFAFENRILQCEDGHLQGAVRWPLSFSYDLARKALRLSITPEKDELWQLDITGGEWRAHFTNASLARIAPLLPAAAGAGDAAESIRPTAGRISGTVRYGPARMDADLRIGEGAFADISGLRAAEKLQGRITLDATRAGTAWTWQAALQWDQGAVFWDPLYIALDSGGPGHRLRASGTQAAGRIAVEQAVLDWQGIGQVTGSADFALAQPAIGTATTGSAIPRLPPVNHSPWGRFVLNARGLQLAALRALLPQTWLDQQALGDLTLKGTADLSLRGAGGEIAEAALRLADASVSAPLRGLALERVDMQWMHASAVPQPFILNLDALRIRDLAFGPIRASGESRDGRLHIPSLVVPLLDGFIGLSDIQIGREDFQLQGALTPVSMEKLTAALGWHPLGGQLAFVLPRVQYNASTLAVDGALLFKLFGGDASVEAIRLENPFGRTPQLTADLHLKRLNLEEMTGAVKFGSIKGYVDVDVEGLVMENWQPVSMDARVVTSDGAFAKRISQRAVQNISSIGGAGAGAAIQRSFLGFFETFGYDRIGLSCRLRNGVCLMGDGTPPPPGASEKAGASAEAASGSFTLIKGGGLPSVNVVGYNRFVGWQELLDRIKAVIDGNSRPVFQ